MEKEKNPMVELVAVILGIFMVIAIMFLILARDFLDALIPISWSFVVLGIIAIIFQYRLLSDKKEKKK